MGIGTVSTNSAAVFVAGFSGSDGTVRIIMDFDGTDRRRKEGDDYVISSGRITMG